MDIFKIIGIGLVGGILTMTVRHIKPEYGVLTGVVSAGVMLFFIVGMAEPVISRFSELTEKSGVNSKYIAAVIKVVGIAYIAQFGAEILRDSGENAIASKVELAGKVFILGITLPVVGEFLEVCVNALSAV